MNTFLAIVFFVALSLFIFLQIRGFVRDLKERKEKKRLSAEKLKDAEQKGGDTFEQKSDSEVE